MADLRDIEDLARQHGWRNVGADADLVDWLRRVFRSLEDWEKFRNEVGNGIISELRGAAREEREKREAAARER